jgi:hypothetical protein
MQALQVAQAGGLSLEHDQPVVVLASKYVRLLVAFVGTRSNRVYLSFTFVSPVSARLRCSGYVKLRSDLLED